MIQFTNNGREYNMGYYFVDWIYPRWLALVKSIFCPIKSKKMLFAQRQEVAMTGVVRAFRCWTVVKYSTCSQYRLCIFDAMYACIILSNMIIEEKRNNAADWQDKIGGSSSGVASESTTRPPLEFREVTSQWAYVWRTSPWSSSSRSHWRNLDTYQKILQWK